MFAVDTGNTHSTPGWDSDLPGFRNNETFNEFVDQHYASRSETWERRDRFLLTRDQHKVKLTHEEWDAPSRQVTGCVSQEDKDSGRNAVQSAETNNTEIEDLAESRIKLFLKSPDLLSHPKRASKENNARLELIEQRLANLVPVRSESELTELEGFIAAIEDLAESIR